MHKDVDTSMLRRAIWNYIHCMFGIRSVCFLTLIKTFPLHEVLGCLHTHMRAHITNSIIPVHHRITAWVLWQVRQVRSWQVTTELKKGEWAHWSQIGGRAGHWTSVSSSSVPGLHIFSEEHPLLHCLGLSQSCWLSSLLCSVGNITCTTFSYTHSALYGFLVVSADKSNFSSMTLSETCKLSLIHTAQAFEIHLPSFKPIPTDQSPDYWLQPPWVVLGSGLPRTFPFYTENTVGTLHACMSWSTGFSGWNRHCDLQASQPLLKWHNEILRDQPALLPWLFPHLSPETYTSKLPF